MWLSCRVGAADPGKEKVVGEELPALGLETLKELRNLGSVRRSRSQEPSSEAGPRRAAGSQPARGVCSTFRKVPLVLVIFASCVNYKTKLSLSGKNPTLFRISYFLVKLGQSDNCM